MAQISLEWVLRRPEVNSAIIGASRLGQIADNVRAVGVTLPGIPLERIDQIIGTVVVCT
jgi:aryl-alcohol dehydrogenase-like predicted oxidoreductase